MRYLGVSAAALGVLLVSSAGSVQAGSVVFKIPTTLSYTINPPRQPPGHFYNASILAAGANGSIYLLDNDNHRVQHYSADGIYLGQFGEFGDRDGQLVNTTSLAVDPDGTVYVGDQYSLTDGKPAVRLQMFDPAGQFIGRSMSPLTGVIGPDHTVYRATQYPARILRYDRSGVIVNTWGTPGQGDGQFGPVVGLAIAADGMVYVADHYNHRIQYFSSSGQFLGKWGGQGTGDGQFSGYLSVAVGKNGVYVSDVGDDSSTIHVQYFSRTGEFRSNTLPMRRSMAEKVGDILTGMDDTLYANFLLPGEIRHYTPDGALLSRWGRFIEGNIIAGGADVSVAGDGSIVLVDGARLVTLGPLGEVKATVDLNGILPPAVHERYFLRVVETSSDGSRYVVAREVEWLPGDEGRVKVSHSMVQLDPSNVVAQTWLLSQGTYVFSHIPPWPVFAVSPDDAIYVLDRAQRIVRRYGDDGHVFREWSLPEVADRMFSEASEIYIAADRTVFVVRYWWDNDENMTPPPPRVERFEPNGELVDEWLFDQQEVRAQGPSSRNSYVLAVGASGVVYLGAKYGWDSAELKAYTADGQLLATWGRTGFGPYREVDRPAFWPIAIDTTRDEGLVVVDNMPGLQSAFVRVFSAVSRDWWRINYFGEKEMTGWPIASQRIAPDGDRFEQDWEAAAPPANVPAEGFAARVEGAITVTGGQHCFDMQSMGGIKVWLDGNLMIDRWNEVETTEEQCMILPTGTHRMYVDYLASGREAKVSVDWVGKANGSSLYLPRVGLSR